MEKIKPRKPKRGDVVEILWLDPACDSGWKEKEMKDADFKKLCGVRSVGIVWLWTASWIELCSTTDGENGADSMAYYRPIITDWRILDG